jgi:signal-transduction protein with cAMP-binding, CBS, and nucleotidyltransferase domain
MVTDRDICMAAYTQGKPVWQIAVTDAASHRLCGVFPEDSVASAEEFMKMNRVRRLAVLDRGRNLVGILSLADIVRSTCAAKPSLADAERVASTMADVFRSHCAYTRETGDPCVATATST